MKRTGYFRKQEKPVGLAVGLLATVILILAIPPGYSNAWRSSAFAAIDPVQRFFRRAATPIRLPAVLSVQQEQPSTAPADPQLIQEYQRVLAANVLLRDQALQQAALLSALGRNEERRIPMVAARVGRATNLYNEPVYGLDRGLQHGVERDAGVLYHDIAVGRIVNVGPNTSYVAGITHRGMRVAVRLCSVRLSGILEGLGQTAEGARCHMRVFTRDLQVQSGERVATSGLDGVFPAGHWVGTVESIRKVNEMEWELRVVPACELRNLEAVCVVRKPQERQNELAAHIPFDQGRPSVSRR